LSVSIGAGKHGVDGDPPGRQLARSGLGDQYAAALAASSRERRHTGERHDREHVDQRGSPAAPARSSAGRNALVAASVPNKFVAKSRASSASLVASTLYAASTPALLKSTENRVRERRLPQATRLGDVERGAG